MIYFEQVMQVKRLEPLKLIDAGQPIMHKYSMNRLSFEKRRQILHLMVEGTGVNAISRLTGVSKVTILRLLEQAGAACMAHHDRAVRGVRASRVECDEIWSFNYCKKAKLATAKAAPEGAGDAWTWTAIDADSKLSSPT
jgi:hypothetical protein